MHESELGTPLYRRSEAVAVNEDHRRAITVAQCSVGVVRGSSVITEVQWVRFGAKLAGVWVLRVSSTKRGWRGPVGGGERVPCLPAMVAVPRACARRDLGAAPVPSPLARPDMSVPTGRAAANARSR